MEKLQLEMMKLLEESKDINEDEDEYDNIDSYNVYGFENDDKIQLRQMDKKYECGPLRNDCIYYSIKNRDGVQQLIDKDDKNIFQKRGWCQFELTNILDIDLNSDINNNNIDLKSELDCYNYKEEYFVHRKHVIQYKI